MLERRVSETIDDMNAEMERFSLEMLCYTIIGTRLNCFSKTEREHNSISSALIKADLDTIKTIALTDQFPQLWRFFETREIKKMKEASQVVEKFLQNVSPAGNSIIKKYSSVHRLDKKDIFGFAADSILSHHSIAYTLSYILYHISKHKNVQDLIYEEAKNVLPHADNSIERSVLNYKIPYTRAVFKEASRLNPLTIGVARILRHDKILSGYFVPKNVSC